MGSFSLFHWIIVAAIVLLLFGRGRIADVMGDFGKGISSFKKGMSEAESEPEPRQVKQIQPPPPQVAPVVQPAQIVQPATPAAEPAPAGEGPAAAARTPEEQAAAMRDPG